MEKIFEIFFERKNLDPKRKERNLKIVIFCEEGSSSVRYEE